MSLCLKIPLIHIPWSQLKINNYCTILHHVKKDGEMQMDKKGQILIPEIIYQELTKQFPQYMYRHLKFHLVKGCTEYPLSISLCLIPFHSLGQGLASSDACYSWWIEKKVHRYLAIINHCLYCQKLFSGILSYSI